MASRGARGGPRQRAVRPEPTSTREPSVKPRTRGRPSPPSGPSPAGVGLRGEVGARAPLTSSTARGRRGRRAVLVSVIRREQFGLGGPRRRCTSSCGRRGDGSLALDADDVPARTPRPDVGQSQARSREPGVALRRHWSQGGPPGSAPVTELRCCPGERGRAVRPHRARLVVLRLLGAGADDESLRINLPVDQSPTDSGLPADATRAGFLPTGCARRLSGGTAGAAQLPRVCQLACSMATCSATGHDAPRSAVARVPAHAIRGSVSSCGAVGARRDGRA